MFNPPKHMQELPKKTAAHLFYLALMFGGMSLSFAKWIVFSKILLPVDFGVYSAVMSSVVIGSYVGAMGLNEYLIQQGSSFHGHGRVSEIYRLRDRFIGVSLLVTVLTLTPICAVSYSMKWWGFSPTDVLVLCAVLLSTVVFGIVDASLRAAQRMLAFASMLFLRAVMLLGLGYHLAQQNGLLGILSAEVASATISIVVALWHWGPGPRFTGLGFDVVMVKTLVRRGFSFLKLQLLRYVSLSLDKLIVGSFLGAVALGHYSFLLIIFLAFSAFSGVYNAVVVPRLISRFSKTNDQGNLAKATLRQAFTFLAVSLLVSPVIIWVLREIMIYHFTEYLFQDLLISAALIYTGSAFHVSTQFFDSFFYALRKQAELTAVAAFGLLLFTAFYLGAGTFQTPSVMWFSAAFFLSKLSWFLITLFRVKQVAK